MAGKTGYPFVGSNDDVLLLKFFDTAYISWASIIESNGYDYARAITETEDGGYLVAGYTNSFGTGNYDALLLKYTNIGSLSWAMTMGGSAYDYARAVVQTIDGDYILAGYTNSFDTNKYSVLLMKTNQDGGIFGCPACVSASPTQVGVNLEVSSPSISVSSPLIPISAPSPSIEFQSPEIKFVCNGIANIFLPLVIK